MMLVFKVLDKIRKIVCFEYDRKADKIYTNFLYYTNEFDFVRSIYNEILKVEYGFDRSTWISVVVLSIYHEILRYQDFERLDQYVHRK